LAAEKWKRSNPLPVRLYTVFETCILSLTYNEPDDKRWVEYITHAVVADMVTFLITSFVILAFIAIAIYFWQKPASQPETELLPPSPGRGLFVDGPLSGHTAAPASIEAESEATKANRTQLIERAKSGEKSVLEETRNNAELYEELLNLLVADADSDPKLLSLVSYVTRHELPVNKKLAESVIDSYKNAPDRHATAKMLHIAALSDDAAVYQRAAEVALKFWRAGRVPEISALELRSILDGEFWILSSPTRSSGAGFLLKQALAGARRELDAAHNG
jgi:hypothetical protein